MRIIDADALIELIPKTSQSIFENCWTCKLLSAETVKEIINSAPSIDIVRCKECKWSKPTKYANGRLHCSWHYRSNNADDFCSYGEREGE